MKLGTLHTFAALAATFNARNPAPQTINSIDASAEVSSIEAAGVRPYSATSGKLVYVKAIENFYVPGPTLVPIGDFAQVPEADSKDLIRRGQAELATDADVAAAQAAADATSKVK